MNKESAYNGYVPALKVMPINMHIAKIVVTKITEKLIHLYPPWSTFTPRLVRPDKYSIKSGKKI